MSYQFIYLLFLCTILLTLKTSLGEKEDRLNKNQPFSSSDRLEQIAILKDKVDCLKEGNANTVDTIEQARLAKEKVTEAKNLLESAVNTEEKTAALEKLRKRISEAKAIISKAAEYIENIKASCKKDIPAPGSTSPPQ